MNEKWTPIYKVGDVVRVKEGLKSHKLYGNKSGVLGRWVALGDMVRSGGKTFRITRIDSRFECYNLEGFHTLMWTEGMLEPVDDNWKILIVPNGDKTEARLYENGQLIKTTYTKKHPDDKYDKFEASKVLIERLFGKEAPNGKSCEHIVKQDTYEIGDKVKIVKTWKPFSGQNLDGEMDKYLDTVMTVKYVFRFLGKPLYLMEEDNERFAWTDLTIRGKVM